MSLQTLTVLDELLVRPSKWRYGYQLSRETGLKSGTLYPILMRLAKRRLLETRWETIEPGTPPRHMYRLTPDGLQFARQKISAPQLRSFTHRPAYGEGRS